MAFCKADNVIRNHTEISRAMRNFTKLESKHVFVEDFLDDDENSDVPEDFYPVKKNNNNNGFYFN